MIGDGRERFLGLGLVVLLEREEAFRAFLIGEGDRIGGLGVNDDAGLAEDFGAPRPGKGSCFHLVGGRDAGLDDEEEGSSWLNFSRASPKVGRGGGGDSAIGAASGVYGVYRDFMLRALG